MAWIPSKWERVFDVSHASGTIADTNIFVLQAWFVAWMLAAFSLWNAVYTFWRSRAYRFFEANVEKPAGTPSAQRVRVQSSPNSPTPLRLLGNVLGESAESRAHPDRTRDVWELHLWDPLPASLQLFCLFSPVHVLIYMLALPLAPLDPHPSVTVFKCFVEQVALSALLLVLESAFTQQGKDSAHVQKEVMREYDIKYVHPRLHPVVRDVGTQCGEDDSGDELEFVELGTPNTQIRRAFRPNPNPNYISHFDPDKLGHTPPNRSSGSPPVIATPVNRTRPAEMFNLIHKSRPSPLRQSMPSSTTPARNFSPEKLAVSTATPARSFSPEKVTVSNASTSTSKNYGGSLGVFSHSQSPLKKAANINDMRDPTFSPRNSRELAAIEQRDLAERMIRKSSPKKENRRSGLSTSVQYDDSAGAESETSPNPFANMGKHRRFERFPSRW